MGLALRLHPQAASVEVWAVSLTMQHNSGYVGPDCECSEGVSCMSWPCWEPLRSNQHFQAKCIGEACYHSRVYCSCSLSLCVSLWQAKSQGMFLNKILILFFRGSFVPTGKKRNL